MLLQWKKAKQEGRWEAWQNISEDPIDMHGGVKTSRITNLLSPNIYIVNQPYSGLLKTTNHTVDFLRPG